MECMRLWSLHPGYLDAKGLVALWRESLLAQAVLAGRTRGYRRHPQLVRFLESPDPQGYVAAYLRAVYDESVGRGYRFDERKIGAGSAAGSLTVTRGQLEYEREHLLDKLRVRAPEWLEQLDDIRGPRPHPLFRVVAGGVAEWEVVAARSPTADGDAIVDGHAAKRPLAREDH